MTHALVVDFGGVRRCLSSAVVGGGLRDAHGWLNLQVPHGYARMDPEVHLHEEMAARGLDPDATLGAMTAAHVDRATEHEEPGAARVFATVGIGVPIAAAGRHLHEVPAVNTINILVLVEAPLTDGALVYAVQTATEAKAQGLATPDPRCQPRRPRDRHGDRLHLHRGAPRGNRAVRRPDVDGGRGDRALRPRRGLRRCTGLCRPREG